MFYYLSLVDDLILYQHGNGCQAVRGNILGCRKSHRKGLTNKDFGAGIFQTKKFPYQGAVVGVAQPDRGSMWSSLSSCSGWKARYSLGTPSSYAI